jgi:hypothetical protein
MAIISRTIPIGWGITGVTLFYAIYSSGTLVQARSSTGISELPSGSGIYQITSAAFDTSWGETTFVVDDGTIKFPMLVPAFISLDTAGNAKVSSGTGSNQINLNSGVVQATVATNGIADIQASRAAKLDNLDAAVSSRSTLGAGAKMDIVDAPNSTAVTAIQQGLATAATQNSMKAEVDTIVTKMPDNKPTVDSSGRMTTSNPATILNETIGNV